MKKFDFDKIKNFDRHINLSIPDYENLTKQIETLAQYYIEEGTNVYDLGCSTGRLLKRIAVFNNVNYYGIDSSSMIPKCRGKIEFIKQDLGTFKDIKNASFITSIFTMQFLSRQDKETVLERIRWGLNENGVFVICEKVYSEDSKLQDIINSMYYEYKEKNFKVDEILAKERELRMSLRLNTLRELSMNLSDIGNPYIFWKFFNFVGIIVVKNG